MLRYTSFAPVQLLTAMSWVPEGLCEIDGDVNTGANLLKATACAISKRWLLTRSLTNFFPAATRVHGEACSEVVVPTRIIGGIV